MLTDFLNKEIQCRYLENILNLDETILLKSYFVNANWDKKIILTEGIISIIDNELTFTGGDIDVC